ncbi:UNVERIFIED_CONTAM: hypothetical protein FKN15_008581, partial [Acipenser sinensis]
CRFSQMLHPIFEESSNVVREEFPDLKQVVFARVDCDQHSDIAMRYRINKYPTLKLFRNGMMMKREYRGQRSVSAIADFIRQQKVDPVKEMHDLEELKALDRSKRNIIGYFEGKDSENYRTFEKVANILRDDCVFLAAHGSLSKPERFSGDNVIYKPPGDNSPDMVYLGSLSNFDLTYTWAQDKCVPMVREITFENGEELTEEGLPFLILFHLKEDTESLEKFQHEAARQLIGEKGTINFLHADCEKFRHPLLHIQKTPADCPVIAIDSFRHMYVFPDFSDLKVGLPTGSRISGHFRQELTEEGLPFLILFHLKEDTESLEKFQHEAARQLIGEKGTINFLHADCEKFRHPLLHIQKTPADCPVIAIDSFRHMYVFPDFNDLTITGKLKQFVQDLHSGKLHREFHHGPDHTDVTPGQQENQEEIASNPPESSFQKLAPSETRYTILNRDRDEL